MNFIALGVQIAILMVGGILGGIGLGYLADKYLGIFPFGIIVGIILGVFTSGAAVMYIIRTKN